MNGFWAALQRYATPFIALTVPIAFTILLIGYFDLRRDLSDSNQDRSSELEEERIERDALLEAESRERDLKVCETQASINNQFVAFVSFVLTFVSPDADVEPIAREAERLFPDVDCEALLD